MLLAPRADKLIHNHKVMFKNVANKLFILSESSINIYLHTYTGTQYLQIIAS